MKTKTCTKCKEVKSLDEFFKNKQCKSGYRGHCKSCTRDQNRKRTEKLEEIFKKRANLLKETDNICLKKI